RLATHLAWLPLRLAHALATRRGMFASALVEAVARLGQVMLARRAMTLALERLTPEWPTGPAKETPPTPPWKEGEKREASPAGLLPPFPRGGWGGSAQGPHVGATRAKTAVSLGRSGWSARQEAFFRRFRW